MNAVAPGDELMGIARGFFSAGSPTVLMSLWTIDDEATTELMVCFYSELAKTKSPAGCAAHRTDEVAEGKTASVLLVAVRSRRSLVIVLCATLRFSAPLRFIALRANSPQKAQRTQQRNWQPNKF